jgi:hypothetical protein
MEKFREVDLVVIGAGKYLVLTNSDIPADRIQDGMVLQQQRPI